MQTKSYYHEIKLSQVENAGSSPFSLLRATWSNISIKNVLNKIHKFSRARQNKIKFHKFMATE